MCYLTRRQSAPDDSNLLSASSYLTFCCPVFIHTNKQEKIVSGDNDMKACMSLNHRTLGNYGTWLEFLNTFIVTVTLVQIFSLSIRSGRTGLSAGRWDLVLVSNSNCANWPMLLQINWRTCLLVMLSHQNHVYFSKSISESQMSGLQRSCMKHC